MSCVRLLVARSIVNNSYCPVRFDWPHNTTDFPSGLQAGVTSPRSAGGFPGTGLQGHAEINRRLGEPDYPATATVDRWLKAVLAG